MDRYERVVTCKVMRLRSQETLSGRKEYIVVGMHHYHHRGGVSVQGKGGWVACMGWYSRALRQVLMVQNACCIGSFPPWILILMLAESENNIKLTVNDVYKFWFSDAVYKTLRIDAPYNYIFSACNMSIL